tara:strand:+ start:806 stop:1207 length:402 start_codon:yes stop_codon:yes gene_type:complete
MNIKSIKLKKYTDKKNVSLTPVYLNKLSKFKIKRLFILDGKINVIRGRHAHKKCTQIFLPIKGKSEIKLTKNFTKKYLLDPKHLKLLRVPPLTWCEIKFLEKDCLIIVLCDVNFNKKEYIRNYKNFIKILNKS